MNAVKNVHLHSDTWSDTYVSPLSMYVKLYEIEMSVALGNVLSSQSQLGRVLAVLFSLSGGCL